MITTAGRPQGSPLPLQMHVPVFAGYGELAYEDRLVPHPQAADDALVGTFHPGVLITHRLPLSALAEGVSLMRSGQAMKVAIQMAEHGPSLS